MLRCVRLVGPALALIFLIPALAGTPPSTQLPGLDGPMRGVPFLKPDPKRKAGAKEEAKKDDDKPFAEIVKGFEPATNGLFFLYRMTNDPTRVLLELQTNQFDTVFLFSATQERGTGERGLYSSQMGGTFPCSFRRVGKQVQWIVKNPTFTAEPGTAAARAVQQSFLDSIAGTVKILSAPHPERQSVLVEAGDLFLNDYGGYASQLNDLYPPGGFNFDKGASYFGPVRAFPENVLFDLHLHYLTGNPKVRSATLPDPRSVPLVMVYELSAVRSSPGFQPRPADERVGHFLTVQQDFTSDRPKSPFRRHVHRWHLEKQDPSAPVSPPRQPIVFWLENTIPHEYRAAFREGVLLWNPAFERIGFTNAIECRQMPEDAGWDPADTRYNTIRWFAGVDAGFAIGPSRANPFTGEIFDADIGFSEAMTRSVRRLAEESVEPVSPAPSSPSSHLGEVVAQWRRGVPVTCQYGFEKSAKAAFAASVLAARPDAPPALTERLIHEFLVEVVAHEVGHTLGLRHNFVASTILPESDLLNTNRTQTVGQSASVMDYNPIVVALPGETQGDFVPTRLGPYDFWAIEYAYRPLTPGQEEAELRAIATRAGDPMLAYATDEDALGTFSVFAMDPYVNQFDASSDPLAFERRQLALVREVWNRADPRLVEPGEGYQVLRRVLNRSFRELQNSAGIASKFVGGVRLSRARAGDAGGRPPLEPVAAARQREALAFLSQEIFADAAYRPPAALMSRLAPERMYGVEGLESFFSGTQRLDYPWHDLVLSVQRTALDRVYHPVVLDRVLDNEVLARAAGQEVFPMAELFETLDRTVWTELESGGVISSTRRNLQREQLRHLVRLALRTHGGQEAPEDASTLARASLVQVGGKVRTAAQASSDPTTRAHLQETDARITAALNAQTLRLVD
ncbi:MAG: zinc-dependent metalloprotease [Verrucomicrobiae bacterium]|nr:zinc-dependent metalloprotease [Verrucomicrobiae bacterium]